MSLRAKGLSFELLEPEKILVSYQDDAGTDEQWDSYLALLHALPATTRLRALVWAEGTPPPMTVQRGIADAVRGREYQVALVSSSIAMRFVVSTFSFVNRSIRYFAPSDLDQALAHVGCSPPERARARQAWTRLGAPL